MQPHYQSTCFTEKQINKSGAKAGENLLLNLFFNRLLSYKTVFDVDEYCFTNNFYNIRRETWIFNR